MLANRKIVIIGAGHVGSHCAYALAIQGICDEIVLVDKDRTKAKSHSMDIADSVSFFNSSVIVRCGDYSDCKDADIIVISAGVPRLPGQTRLDVLDGSVECVRDIISNLNKNRNKRNNYNNYKSADIIADFVRKATGCLKTVCLAQEHLLTRQE